MTSTGRCSSSVTFTPLLNREARAIARFERRAIRLGCVFMLRGNSLVVVAQDIRKMLSEMERDREIRHLRRRLTEKDG